MNEIVSKFLLAGDKFMFEMYLRKHEFIYSACGPFTKIKKRIQKFKEAENSRYYYPKLNRWRFFSTWHGLWKF